MTPYSPEMSFFSVASFELNIYHNIVKKKTPKIGQIRKERTNWRFEKCRQQ